MCLSQSPGRKWGSTLDPGGAIPAPDPPSSGLTWTFVFWLTQLTLVTTDMEIRNQNTTGKPGAEIQNTFYIIHFMVRSLLTIWAIGLLFFPHILDACFFCVKLVENLLNLEKIGFGERSEPNPIFSKFSRFETNFELTPRPDLGLWLAPTSPH